MNISWAVYSVPVTEGVNRTVEIYAVSSGAFARPISIGVACAPILGNYYPGTYIQDTEYDIWEMTYGIIFGL